MDSRRSRPVLRLSLSACAGAIGLCLLMGLCAQAVQGGEASDAPSAPSASAASAASGAVVGWRTDGMGRYPEATPPLHWSTSENVLWKTSTKAWSNATPVIVGEKIFLCAEEDHLLCLNAADGKELWSTPVKAKVDATPEQIQEARTKLGELDKQREALHKESRKLRGQIRKLAKDEAKAEELKALTAKREDLRARMEAIDKERAPYIQYAKPKTHKVNGYSSPTPVVAGDTVYSLFGTGVAGAHGLDGAPKWTRFVEAPRHNWGHSASPLLAGDTLIVHINDTVHGLDAATGETRWTARGGGSWGTGLAFEIGGEPVVLTVKGLLLRAADGKVLADKLFDAPWNGPIIAEGVVYVFDERGAKALRMPEAISADGAMKDLIQELWSAKVPKDRYYATPLIHDGLLYNITRKGVWTVLEADTGKEVYSQKLTFGGKEFYPSPTLVGDKILVSRENGTTAVIEPGREYKEIRRNELEPFRACPVAMGDRLYIRGLKHLYCIAKP